ncbi:MAG: hypothetical protein HY815_01535 [Candidatus Riflebacteria bacterium]|nr:hypothetical protein [Candidatus Riflebacteria bacterium]
MPFLLVGLLSFAGPIPDDVRLSRSAESCRVCHLEIYREWKESWHSKATRNRNFTLALQKWTAEGNHGDSCFRCHASRSIFLTAPPQSGFTPRVHVGPGGAKGPVQRHEAWQERAKMNTLEEPEPFAQREQHLFVQTRQEMAAAMARQPLPRADLLGEGVNCQSCHEGPRNEQVGPYDVAAPHPTLKEPSMKTTRACISCHGQLHAYCQKQVQAWELAPLSARKVCQACHMPARDGKLVQWINFENLPTRKVASHAFPGAHDPNTLRSAVRVEVEVVEGMVVVALHNRGASHLVPGSPWRKLIALVQVFDAMGREVYRKRDGFFQERGNAIPPLGRENITFMKRSNHASVKVTLFYRFYPNQPDLDADKVAERSFSL